MSVFWLQTIYCRSTSSTCRLITDSPIVALIALAINVRYRGQSGHELVRRTSAFDAKRTCRFWQRRRRAAFAVAVRIQKADTGEYDRINVLSPFWLSTRSQAQNLKLSGGATCCRHSKQLRQNRVHPRRRNEPKVL